MNVKRIYALCWLFILIGWVVAIPASGAAKHGDGYLIVLFFSSIGMLGWWSHITYQEKKEKTKAGLEAEHAEREERNKQLLAASANFGKADFATAEERKPFGLVSKKRLQQ